MKKFVALYMGTHAARENSGWDKLNESERKAREAAGMKAWMDWGVKHGASIVDQGGPLGKTKRTAKGGVSDTKNAVAGYVIVQAESHEAAAKMFENHPHFAIFPGDSVEIMEMLPIPSR